MCVVFFFFFFWRRVSIKLSVSLKFVPSRLRPRTKMVDFFFILHPKRQIKSRNVLLHKNMDTVVGGQWKRYRSGGERTGPDCTDQGAAEGASQRFLTAHCVTVTEVKVVMTKAEHTSLGDTRTHTHAEAAACQLIGRWPLTPTQWRRSAFAFQTYTRGRVTNTWI